VGQRVDGALETDLDRAFDAGEIVRTHVMRPTWHFVAPEDLRWLLSLTAPRVHQASAYQYRQLGLDAPTRARGRRVIEKALRGGASMIREELGAALSKAGIDADGLRLTYFVMDAELEGVVCSGPRRGKRHTYALLEERIPPTPARRRDEALAEIGRRYVEGHGPAQVADLAWWSGLTVADARIALESATPPLVREQLGDRTLWASPTQPAPRFRSPVVHLLPNYDELLIAFRDRTDAMDPALPPPARVTQVILAHIIVRNGLGVAGYRRRDEKALTRLSIDLLVALDPAEKAALRAAADRFATFLGRPVETVGLD